MERKRKWLAGIIAASMVGLMAAAACSVQGAVVTKLDLCLSLTNSYCKKATQLGCGGADTCRAENEAMCGQLFDDTCSALREMGDKIDHDINNIINPKDTCEGLSGIDGYLQGTIEELKASGCESSGEYD
ncbi:MAG: hypothetical protein GXP54_06555 [Deltaproteobacteria bacterium]|nr:hypothetical protein [Deltaproteobacteria bacterium]